MTTLDPLSDLLAEAVLERPTAGAVHHLRAAGVSLVVDTRGPRLPGSFTGEPT